MNSCLSHSVAYFVACCASACLCVGGVVCVCTPLHSVCLCLEGESVLFYTL